MSERVRLVAETYVRASCERDPTLRWRLLEECFAADGRFVTRGRQLSGRAELDAMIGRFLADPQWRGIRLTSAIDAGETTFRVSSVAERHDGTTLEAYDVGELDDDGRIRLVLTFTGPLAPAVEGSSA